MQNCWQNEDEVERFYNQCWSEINQMDTPYFLFFLGLVYIVVFGGLALMRREGLSLRFAVEALVITLVLGVINLATGNWMPPILFLILLYLATMRVRLMVDVGNIFARRGRFTLSERIYQLALTLWPDETARMIVQVNLGAACIQQGEYNRAIDLFQQLIQSPYQNHLGLKYEAAAHYNLGVAFSRKGMHAQAIKEFNNVLEAFPISEYGRQAQIALERERSDLSKSKS